MRPRRILSQGDFAEIFDRAVEESALAVVTLPVGEGWVTFKSRFLERDPQQRFIVLDYAALPDRELPVLTPGQYAGISFRQRSRKLLFGTVIDAQGRYMADGNRPITAIRYRWPESLTELQRRAYFRTPIPTGMKLQAHAWPGGTAARESAQQQPLQIISGHLLDLSCGGTLLEFHTSSSHEYAPDETMGVELHLNDGKPPLLVNALYRGRRDNDGIPAMALQFVALELAPDGRNTLNRIAACVQKLNRTLLPSEARRGSARHEL